jgi:hypothetical protein
MKLPFTSEQFFEVFSRYNLDVWPVQIVLILAALAAVLLVLVRRSFADRLISAILSVLWLWTGVAYHIAFFSAINKAAYGFGLLFVIGSLLFFLAGVVKRKMQFSLQDIPRRVIGYTLMIFAIVVYPLLSGLFGHGYPAMPTFGLPCPTTIFTVGLLCLLAKPYPKYILIVPILWSVIGSQAVLFLGVYQDLGLLLAGLVGVFLMVNSKG